MEINMGKLDRWVRIVIAFVLITLYYTETITGTSGIIGLVLATVFLFTGMVGICPLYSLMGIRTCPKKT